jgi:hypothetical protein
LGEVRDVAEVILNGKSMGITWKAPYHIDVTGLLKQGNNKLELKVTNEWNNRITGDRIQPPGKEVLSGTGLSRRLCPFGQSATLEWSGFLGAVVMYLVKAE